MACIRGVVSMDYLKKKTKFVVRDETFAGIILKVGKRDQKRMLVTEFSANGSDWMAVEGDTINVPALGVYFHMV
jgi:hypothetical protein